MGLLGVAPGRSQVERLIGLHLLEHLAAPVRPMVRDQPVAEVLEGLLGLELREDPDRLVALDVDRQRHAHHLCGAGGALVANFRHAASLEWAAVPQKIA